MLSAKMIGLLAAVLVLRGSALETPTIPQKNDSSQDSSTAKRPQIFMKMELLTDPEGVDFESAMRSIYQSVKKDWMANMPSSAEKGQQGINAVEFHILRDGGVPRESLKLKFGSNKNDFDTASLQAVRDSAPFDPLPGKFTKPFIELRLTFYYNTRPE